jgi:dTMP kinase
MNTTQLSRGYIIVFEGGEGAGKGTCIERLVAYIDSTYGESTALVTHEPGGGIPDIREKIFELDKSLPDLAERELALFEEDRRVHCQSVIIPAVVQKKVVILDRFYQSTVAYQGYARGMNLKLIHEANKQATEGVEEDLIILLDIDPRIGLSRKYTNQPEKLNRFEREGYDFHDKVRLGYHAQAAVDSKSWVIVDASRPQDDVWHDVIKSIQERLGI